ncbi:MAG: hypothetical protein ACRD2X_28350, partial [Vicinamibacteraceae bacterium]
MRADGDGIFRQVDGAESNGPATAPGARRTTPFWMKAALAIAVVVAAAEGANIAWGGRTASAPAQPQQPSAPAGRSAEARRPPAPPVDPAKADATGERARFQAPSDGDAAASSAQ